MISFHPSVCVALKNSFKKILHDALVNYSVHDKETEQVLFNYS